MKKQNKGFTLIELLVALTILALVGAMVTTGLRASITTQNRLNINNERLAAVQSAILIMERDIALLIDRPVYNYDGVLLPALSVRPIENKAELEFTHGGVINPMSSSQASTLQRVRYQLDENGNLIRTVWLALDRVSDTQAITQILLTGVHSFTVRFLPEQAPDEENSSMLTQQAPAKKLPRAIEFTLQINGMGEVTRFISFS